MSLEWHALQVRTPSPGPAPWHAPQRSECHSSVQPWLSWLHASAPKAAAGVASGTPRFFDGLRKQILVQLAASSLLHFLLQSEPSRQELRNRLQFPPAKLNRQRNTNPPTLHATARDSASLAGGCASKTSRWWAGGDRRLALRSTSASRRF